jgi:hypothetical protein
MKQRALISLYFDQGASYKESIEEIRGRVNILEKKGKIEYREFEADDIRKSDYERLTDEIRSLRPQKRGTVVAKRKFLLPLSNSKKLNLVNTPVLLARSGSGTLEYVFPCLFGETYYDVSKGIDHLDASLPDFIPLSGDMEDTIADNFLVNLAKYEDGLTLLGREVETSAGLADIVLSDKDERHVIVEVERDATEHALGQVLRLSAGYEKKRGLTRSKVRSAIVCARVHDFMRDAATRADVEIWTIS